MERMRSVRRCLPLKLEIGPKIIMKFDNGFYITNTTFFGLIVAAFMIIMALWLTGRMEKIPRGKQVVAEFIVEFVYKLTTDTMGKQAKNFAPYIGTLFIYLIIGNALGLIGWRPVTADVNTTFALAFITFLLIQITAIRNHGVGGKLKEMCRPYPFMFPLNIIEQISFPISLAFRLFGNILAGVIVMELLYHGLHVFSDALHLPIPLLQAVIPLPANFFFDVFEPILQAFIFTMLTMVFISREILIQSAFSETH